MRRYSLTARRLILADRLGIVASLAIAASAQAVRRQRQRHRIRRRAYAQHDRCAAGLQVSTQRIVQRPVARARPELGDHRADVSPLCYHGGSVLTSNETYVLTWDPDRRYWATTRQYVEQFLSDVADREWQLRLALRGHARVHRWSNGQRSTRRTCRCSPAAASTTGTTPAIRHGYTCQFGANAPSGTGNDYPTTGLPAVR